MRYWLWTVAGLTLTGIAIIAATWGVYHLGRTSTCASGGPYVSAHQCSAGTGGYMLAITGGVFGGIGGAILYGLRGGEDRPGLPMMPLLWTLTFGLTGAAGLVSRFGPASGKGGGAGFLMAIIFIPLAIGGLVSLVRNGAASATDTPPPITGTRIQPSAFIVPPAGPGASTPFPFLTAPVAGPPPSGDSVDRLERLADLHANGTLTDAEFAAQKQRILGEA